MLRSKFKWYILLLVSSVVLIWRLLDFVYEAVNEGVHMTRGGFALQGAAAEVIEVAIILGSLALTWNAITNLMHLHLTNSSK